MTNNVEAVIDLSHNYEDLREPVRALCAKFPGEYWRAKDREREYPAEFVQELTDAGFLAAMIPEQYGGSGLGVGAGAAILEEIHASGCNGGASHAQMYTMGTVLRHGSDEQKAHYLPRILSAEDWWCQGYSEPNAGSDLASLSCRAIQDGDDYVVNGTKMWTTWAQYADWIFCLVRTSTEGKRQAGISFLLIDINTPGITVRPVITIEGDHEVNQVFFEDVRVPAANLIGEENQGWTYAKVLLGHERFMSARTANAKRALAKLKRIAANEQSGGRPMIENTRFCERMAVIETEIMALEYTTLRFIAAAAPGPR